MPNSDPIREAVDLLRRLSEEEREKYLELLALNPDEKEEVRRRLWAQPTRRVITPEELRDMIPFRRLAQDVRRGKAILFVGAGVSQDVGMPSSGTLVDALLAIAKDYRVPLEDRPYTLPQIAGLLERATLRDQVIKTLKNRIEVAYRQEPPPYQRGFFRLLPFLSELNRVILTTNWDELIERALSATEEPVSVIRHDRELALWASTQHAVVKLHGDLTAPETIVVSDTDYARAQSDIIRAGGLAGTLWGLASTLWSQYSCIFVGYQLSDPDINLLRLLVANRQTGTDTRNYMVGPFDDSEQRALRSWMSMEVIPATAAEFFVALARELAEFANRHDDLDRIFRKEAAPFLEFYAPFGTGKHTLLDAVERRARSEGWDKDQIIRVDLKLAPQPLTVAGLVTKMAEVIGDKSITKAEDLKKKLEYKGRLFVILEHTEAAEKQDWSGLIEFITEIIVPVIRKLNEAEVPRDVPGAIKNRLVLSGCYPVEGWPYTFKRDAEIFPLTPFSLSAVREMVGKYILFRDPRTEIPPPPPQLAQQIYDLTGRSNPGFIKMILDDLMKKIEKPGAKLELLTDSEKDLYLEKFIETIRREIWVAYLKDRALPVETLFAQGLCVLRRFNLNLLARLGKTDVFHDPFSQVGGTDTILNALKVCHLLTYEYPLEVVDPVIRRIHTEFLRRKYFARFCSAHQAAASAWHNLLGSVLDETFLVFFQEWLYHQASYLLHLADQTQDFRWQTLSQQIDDIPFRTSQPSPTSMGKTLLQKIEEKKERDKERDGELLDVLLECLGENRYEDLRDQLLKKPEVTQ